MITKEDIEKAKQDDDFLVELIDENEGLILTAIRRYLNRKIENEDIWQEAKYAFVKSVREYDPNNAMMPSSYIYMGVMNHVNTYTRSNTGIVQVPYPAIKAQSMMGNGFSIEEIANKLGKTIETVELYLRTNLDIESVDNAMDSVEGREQDNVRKIHLDIYDKLSSKDFSNGIINREYLYCMLESVKDYLTDDDFVIVSNYVLSDRSLAECYRDFHGDKRDKQGRAIGYPAFNLRLNKIRNKLKNSELRWL